MLVQRAVSRSLSPACHHQPPGAAEFKISPRDWSCCKGASTSSWGGLDPDHADPPAKNGFWHLRGQMPNARLICIDHFGGPAIYDKRHKRIEHLNAIMSM
jgi:hypothetical protein